MLTDSRADLLDDSIRGALKIVGALALAAADGSYIFRAETQCYERVSSSLYREYSAIASELSIEAIQRADLEEARRYTHETDEFAILTELQHYGGRTNLIDFTADYLIAIFFACDGNHLQDGRVVFLDRNGDMGDHIFGPNNPISRVLAQKSVFVRPPKG